VRGEHAGGVREREQLRAGGAVEGSGQVVGGPARGAEEVGAADVADEQRVAGEHAVRLLLACVDHDADRLRRVARRVPDLQLDVAEREAFAVVEPVDGELDLRGGAERDPRPGGGGQLEVAGEEVGVDVGLDHPLDHHALGGRVGEVLGDVALRVDDHRAAGAPVAHQVGRLGETTEVVLLEEQHGWNVHLVGQRVVRHDAAMRVGGR
jgi:hypothetical protein